MEGELPESSPASFEVRVLPDPEALAEEAAREFAAAAAEGIAARGVFRVVLSGGSTPRALYRRLTQQPYRDSIDWRRIHFFWTDERCVPPEHERSNYRMAKETLLAPLQVPGENVFRMRGEEEPRQAAAEYAEILKAEFVSDRGMPRFDLVFLGLGSDGHTASLFPGTKALGETKSRVAANYVAQLREWRLTLTYPVVNAARHVVCLASGEEKSGAVAKILKKERGYRQLPASLVRPGTGSLLWLLDHAAAALL